MIYKCHKLFSKCIDSLQIRFVVNTTTLIIVAATNLFAAEQFTENIFVNRTIKTQKVKISLSPIKSPLDDQIQPARLAGEVKTAEGSAGSSNPLDLKASAGDDVLAYVGRRATLNGGLSQPAGRIGTRWIQIAGPPIVEAISQGPNLIVVAPAPGSYQFLLVVAEGGKISEPDSVTLVAVDHPADQARQIEPSQNPIPAPSVPEKPATPVVADTPRELLVKLTRQTLDGIPNSSGLVKSLAEMFADVSQKMNLYTNYAEAQDEMSRRISALMESQSTDVQTWNSRVFEPLTLSLVIWVRPSGLELGDQSQWLQPLTALSRSAIKEGLTAISEGFQERNSSILTGDSETKSRTESVATKDRGQPMIRK